MARLVEGSSLELLAAEATAPPLDRGDEAGRNNLNQWINK